MNNADYICSEWTEEELKGKVRCFCPCHTHPGVYPTSAHDPCSLCQHANELGYFPGFATQGWVEYWRLDKQ